LSLNRCSAPSAEFCGLTDRFPARTAGFPGRLWFCSGRDTDDYFGYTAGTAEFFRAVEGAAARCTGEGTGSLFEGRLHGQRGRRCCLRGVLAHDNKTFAAELIAGPDHVPAGSAGPDSQWLLPVIRNCRRCSGGRGIRRCRSCPGTADAAELLGGGERAATRTADGLGGWLYLRPYRHRGGYRRGFRRLGREYRCRGGLRGCLDIFQLGCPAVPAEFCRWGNGFSTFRTERHADQY
jgi:hypothetical protein